MCGSRTDTSPSPSSLTLADRLARHLTVTDLLPDGPALIALSGGRDSVALLHLLRFPLGRSGLVAAHFDHAMRPDSAADADWVAGLCRAWDVPLVRERAPFPPRSEAEARTLRYAFLHAAAGRVGASRIVTAHHADDQAETLLFRLLRGTGPRGLMGIPERRGDIVRPLLPFGRDEIDEYAKRHAVPCRDDPTNTDPKYARNRIRHRLLPALEALSPGTRDALLAVGAAALALDEAWSAVLRPVLHDVVLREHEEAVELARTRLLAYDSHVSARIVRHLLRRFGSSPGRAGTRAALEFIMSGASGGQVRVAGGVRIRRDFDRIWLGRATDPVAPDRDLVIPAAGRGNGSARVGGVDVVVDWRMLTDAGDGDAGCFDADALRFPLTLRGWRAGDRIRLKYGTKKLKKLFAERRIGRNARARVPVLADDAGRVLWVVGVARSVVAAPGAAGNLEIRVEMPNTAEMRARTGGRDLERIVFDEQSIARRVGEMAREIGAAYPEGEPLLVIGLLKGSFIFLADLVRQIPRPVLVDFLVAASYGSGTVSSGEVRLLYDPEASLTDRHVLLVEDIIDSGTTLNRLIPRLEARGPRSLELCALLHKHIARDLVKEPRWLGFDAPREFLVGYGLDHSEDFRNLPFIASL
jgi:hypoxanthine phosphoribosyltransferase